MAKLNDEIKKIEEDLKENKFKKIYLFFGAEKYLKNYYKTQIIESALFGVERDMNLEVITKETYNSDTIRDKIETAPFFSERRIVILDEINVFNKPELMNILLGVPDETIVIVLEESNKEAKDKDEKDAKTSSDLDGDVKKEKFSVSKIKDNKQMKDFVCFIDFNKATDEIISSKIEEISKEYKIKISKANAEYLVQRVGSNLSDIENEMQKLCLYNINKVDKREISKDDIENLCSIRLEEKIFDMITDITNRSAASAIKRYKAMIIAGEEPKTILALIAWQYMLIYECKLALDENKAPFEICNALGAKEYPVKKALDLARKTNKKKLKEIINLCDEVDKGFIRGENNLEFLIYKIIA